MDPAGIRELLTGDTRRLAYVRRYSAFAVLRSENVAEHSFYAAYYAFHVANNLLDRGYIVDVDVVVRKAILHDIGECVTGDIMRPFKYHSKEILDVITATERELVETRLDGPTLEGWRDAKDDTLEGRIVALADVLCVIAYCYEEAMCGNKYIKEVIGNARAHIINMLDCPEFKPYMGACTVLMREIVEGCGCQ